MKLKLGLASLLTSAALCAAPAFAQSHGTHPAPHIGHVFITPVLCEEENDDDDGAFFQWIHIPHSHFTGLTVGMTNPDDDDDVFVGARLDGGIQGQPFGPATTWTVTFVPSEFDESFFATVLNVPGTGTEIIFGQSSVVDNSDGSITATANFITPFGTSFTGIYNWNFDVDEPFTNTYVNAVVDGVTAAPNLHSPPHSPHGFFADCTGTDMGDNNGD